MMANMWWEPVEFEAQVSGDWRVVIDTNLESGLGDGRPATGTVTVAPRSIVVLDLSSGV